MKKRRVIQQPLSELAVEIIREALTRDGQQFVFAAELRRIIGEPVKAVDRAELRLAA